MPDKDKLVILVKENAENLRNVSNLFIEYLNKYNTEITPIALASFDKLLRNINFFNKLKKHVKFPVKIAYALKANYDINIVKILIDKLRAIEISSPFELHILKNIIDQLDLNNISIIAGIHGLHHHELNAYFRSLEFYTTKFSNTEIIISIYDIDSLLKVQKYLRNNKKKLHVLLRLIPYGVTYSKIGIPLKFIEESRTRLLFNGVHEHSLTLFKPTIDKKLIRKKLEYIRSSLEYLSKIGKLDKPVYVDIGGGITPPIFMNEFDLRVLGELINNVYKNLDYLQYIVIELGRGLVGDAIAIYSRIASLYGRYVVLDASTNTLVPFPTAFYVMIQERCIDIDIESWNVYWNDFNETLGPLLCGRLCSINDIIPGVVVQCDNIHRDDRFLILNVGAYALNMQSNFIYQRIRVMYV